MAKTAAQLYEERQQRVQDAIDLKEPDRVPVSLQAGYFPSKHIKGVVNQDAFFEPAKWRKALVQTIVDYEPDVCGFTGAVPGATLDTLEFKQLMFPGHGLGPNSSHQFVEGEYLKADEYDAFLKDPTDFIIRTYMPRVAPPLEALGKLPPLSMLFGYPMLTGVLGMPQLDDAIKTLAKARAEAKQWYEAMAGMSDEVIKLGFPIAAQSATFAPFDIVGDRLRGMRGMMLDMYRKPDKAMEVADRMLPLMLEAGIAGAKRSGNPRVMIPLHWGAEGFMSLEQYKKFYWPGFKALLQGLIDAGCIPAPFFEGDFGSRLEFLLELPKGKMIGHFDNSDIKKVKEILGDHLCIQGNVPSSLLQTGTPQEVSDYCKQLIDICAPGGGFILSPRSVIDEAKPENIRAMVETTKEYGVYK